MKLKVYNTISRARSGCGRRVFDDPQLVSFERSRRILSIVHNACGGGAISNTDIIHQRRRFLGKFFP